MLLLSLALIALVVAGIALLLIMRLNSRYSHQLAAQSQQFQDTTEQISILRSEVSELRTGLVSIGKRVLDIEQQCEELVQQQAAQKYDDPDAKIYSRAVKMVELGADLNEVIRECELPRAEAELLFSLHKQKGG